MGALHLPLYAGLLFMGRVQAPQPGASSHLGLGMRGGSHSPSSSSSQSSGCFASAHVSERLLTHAGRVTSGAGGSCVYLSSRMHGSAER